MSETLQVIAWIVIALPSMLIVAWIGSRLLGVSRSWVRVIASGFIGFVAGWFVTLAGNNWDVNDPGFARDLYVLALVITMLVSILLDMLSKPGTLSRDDDSTRAELPHPIRNVRDALKPLSRYREIVDIARRNGFGPALGLRGHVDHQNPEGVRLRHTFEECGGMFVKLGQMASTRTDLLPHEITSELAKLQSDAQPSPEAEVRTLVEHELGAPVDDVFAEFDWSPLAAASIAQAYAARLKSGDSVVVKVRRPGISELVDRDTEVVLQLARTVQKRTVFGARYDILGLAEEFIHGLYRELDFDNEARNALALRHNIESDAEEVRFIKIPRVYTELSTKRVLVEERLEGEPLGNGSTLDAMGVDRKLVADRLLTSFLHQMMFDGFFHADPHPGNVFVLPDSTIGLIDFGAMGLLDPITRDALKEMVLAVTHRDARQLREAVGAVTEISSNTDQEELDRALAKYMAEHVQPGSGIDAHALNDLAPLFHDFGITLPVGLTSFGRTLVILEGTLGVIAPGYSIADSIQEISKRWKRELLSEEQLKALAIKEAVALGPTLQRLPRRLDDLSAQMVKGQLTTKIRLFSNGDDVDVIARLANRFVLAFVGATTAALSAALIVTDAGPDFAGEATLLNAIGYVGLFGGVVLMLRVVAQTIREGLN